MDGFEEMELAERLRAFAERETTTIDPEDVAYLLRERAKYRRLLDAWHGYANHIQRIIDAPRGPMVKDLPEWTQVHLDRIEEIRRTPL